MTERTNTQEEFALQTMFGHVLCPVADEGFSKTVLVRVQKNIWKRRVVLLFSVSIGLIIGLPAISHLLLMLSNELTEFAASAQNAEALGQLQIFLAVLPLRESAQIVSEEIASYNARIDAVTWYLQNKVYILAGLMAALSLVATRILSR